MRALLMTPKKKGWKPGANTKVYYNINNNDTNSTIFDLSGNNINQNWNNHPSYVNDSTYGRVAYFDGGTDTFTSASSIVNFGNNVTFIALCNFNTQINNRPRVLISQTQANNRWAQGIGEGIFAGGIYTTFSAGMTTNVVNSGINPTEGVWYMIAGTRDSNGVGKIYINGELVNTVTGLTPPDYSRGSNLRIGNRGDNTNWFHGLFKLFIGEDRVWSADEIKEIARQYGFNPN